MVHWSVALIALSVVKIVATVAHSASGRVRDSVFRAVVDIVGAVVVHTAPIAGGLGVTRVNCIYSERRVFFFCRRIFPPIS